MGMLVIVLGVVVGLIGGFVLPFAVYSWSIPIETMLPLIGILPLAMGACMLLGTFWGLLAVTSAL